MSKIAIVHDYLNQYGGAEKVIEAFHEIYPDVPIYTSIFLPENLPASFQRMDVRPSFMQKLPGLKKHFKKYLLLYPRAVESFDLREYDVILSSSSAFAKGARVPERARHVCYCYSPMRFVWNTRSYLENENLNPLWETILPPALAYLRRWDLQSSRSVHQFIAISEFIRRRIKNAYQRDADVIYPPVDISGFDISPKQDDYFLVVSRLNAYKKIEFVIDVFNRLGLPLVIVGTGPHEPTLRQRARNNVRFAGKVSQSELAGLLSRCRALIFPGEEDFGIAPVEAMASGRPVIAYRGGGALETVIENVSGVFFDTYTHESFEAALRQFEETSWDPNRIRQSAMRFSKEIFQEKIKAYLNSV